MASIVSTILGTRGALNAELIPPYVLRRARKWTSKRGATNTLNAFAFLCFGSPQPVFPPPVSSLRQDRLTTDDVLDFNRSPQSQRPSAIKLMHKLASDVDLASPYNINTRPFTPPPPITSLSYDRLAQHLITQADRVAYEAARTHRRLSFDGAAPRGFLYYFGPNFAPPCARHVRFRVTPSSEPASFASGFDLEDPRTVLPFRLSLRELVTTPSYAPLLSSLYRDELVTMRDITDALELWAIRPEETEPYSGAQLLYALGQPFLLKFPVDQQLAVVGAFEDIPVVQGARLHPFEFRSDRAGSGYPYHGSAICCFERLEGAKLKLTIGIRILKIVTPFTELGFGDLAYPLPREGEMFRGIRALWSHRFTEEELNFTLRDIDTGRAYAGLKTAFRFLEQYPGVSGDEF